MQSLIAQNSYRVAISTLKITSATRKNSSFQIKIQSDSLKNNAIQRSHLKNCANLFAITLKYVLHAHDATIIFRKRKKFILTLRKNNFQNNAIAQKQFKTTRKLNLFQCKNIAQRFNTIKHIDCTQKQRAHNFFSLTKKFRRR